jgi:prophage regulatory protein
MTHRKSSLASVVVAQDSKAPPAADQRVYQAAVPLTAPHFCSHQRLVRIGEVLHRVGVHRGTIYKWIKEGRFPRQIALGANSAAWYETEINEWISDPTGWRPRS